MKDRTGCGLHPRGMGQHETGETFQNLTRRVGRGNPGTHTPPNADHLVQVLGLWQKVHVSGTRDERIAQIAARQRGRVASRQLIAAGIGRSAVRQRTRCGRLFPIRRGVFSVGHPGPVEFGDETAALLAAGDDAALTGLSAAVVWGILDPISREAAVDLITPTARRISHSGIRCHRSTILIAGDIRIHRDLPVLSPARALLDLAEQTTIRRTELAVDHGLVARLLTRADVWDVIERAPTRPGANILRQLVEERPTTVTRSEAEERVLALIRDADLPAPLLNVRLHGFEVDFYWPAQRFVLEVDGYRYHSLDRAFEHDRRKDAVLQAAGIATTRVTWRQATAEPYAVIARLAQALVPAADRGR